jgi:hypothetical protein
MLAALSILSEHYLNTQVVTAPSLSVVVTPALPNELSFML